MVWTLEGGASGNNTNGFSICCGKGRVRLPPLHELPEPLKTLYGESHFKEHIRPYNCAFMMASSGAKVDDSITRGVRPFKISGNVYHRIGTILPSADAQHQFGQIYILDGDDQVQRRMQMFSDLTLRQDIVARIGIMLSEASPFLLSPQTLNLSSTTYDVDIVNACMIVT